MTEQGQPAGAPASQAQKAAAFAALHRDGIFVVPNPWDAGSARMLEALGFAALATTSSGFAFTLGRPDHGVTASESAANTASICAATRVPVTVDLENGFGRRVDDAAAAVLNAAAAGAVGGSIEDYDPRTGEIYPGGHAVERIQAAHQATWSLSHPFVVTARSEAPIDSDAGFAAALARCQAYAAVGADVVFVPALRDLDQIRTLCEAVPVPVNVLARPGMRLDELRSAGVRRVSVGGSLAWTALAAAADAARRIRDDGDFSALAAPDRVPGRPGT